jgi:hypothetical protein
MTEKKIPLIRSHYGPYPVVGSADHYSEMKDHNGTRSRKDPGKQDMAMKFALSSERG